MTLVPAWGTAALWVPRFTVPSSDVPVTPDGPDARRWLIDELSKAPYQAAKPNWFDLLSQAVKDWIGSLFGPSSGTLGPLLIVVLVVLIAALIVVAFIVFGLPRLNRRSRQNREVFGEEDRRDADALRRAAEAAAASGDWTTAIEELFRALARGLAERTILTVSPGTTAHGFGSRAASAFPAERARLSEVAELFDRVRYLGAPGTREGYATLSELEGRLRTAKPNALPPLEQAASAGTPR